MIEDADLNNKTPWDKNLLAYGLATSYSANFMALGMFICLLFVLFLGDAFAPSIVLMFAVMVMLLIILAFTKLENTIVTG